MSLIHMCGLETHCLRTLMDANLGPLWYILQNILVNIVIHPFFSSRHLIILKSLPIINGDGEYKLIVLEIELRNRGFPFVILES